MFSLWRWLRRMRACIVPAYRGVCIGKGLSWGYRVCSGPGIHRLSRSPGIPSDWLIADSRKRAPFSAPLPAFSRSPLRRFYSSRGIPRARVFPEHTRNRKTAVSNDVFIPNRRRVRGTLCDRWQFVTAVEFKVGAAVFLIWIFFVHS